MSCRYKSVDLLCQAYPQCFMISNFIYFFSVLDRVQRSTVRSHILLIEIDLGCRERPLCHRLEREHVASAQSSPTPTSYSSLLPPQPTLLHHTSRPTQLTILSSFHNHDLLHRPKHLPAPVLPPHRRLPHHTHNDEVLPPPKAQPEIQETTSPTSHRNERHHIPRARPQAATGPRAAGARRDPNAQDVRARQRDLSEIQDGQGGRGGAADGRAGAAGDGGDD